jgi:hypothetical protein
MTAQQAMDAYFLETRAKLLEIAATLDRIDRLARGEGGADVRRDLRMLFVADALAILQSAAPNRAELIQRRYSLS